MCQTQKTNSKFCKIEKKQFGILFGLSATKHFQFEKNQMYI